MSYIPDAKGHCPNLIGLADYFNQDFDLLYPRGDIKEPCRDFVSQYGSDHAQKAIVELQTILARIEDGHSAEQILRSLGWEYFPSGDFSGRTWLPKVVSSLRELI